MTYRPEWLSDSAEVLVADLKRGTGDAPAVDFDVVVVGSGYGGAVAAARFAGARDERGVSLRVAVLERGREYVPGAFPTRFSDVPGYVRFSRYDDAGAKGQRDGLFDFRFGAQVSVLLASGLGGGSLINASVAEPAHADVFSDPAWPASIRKHGLASASDRARAMLRPADAPEGDAKHQALRRFARSAGMKVRAAKIAVHQGEAGDNAQGVRQEPCIGCGDCVTGCNFQAKNTLATNYLPLARQHGARLFTNATVSHVRKVDHDDGPVWEVLFRLTVDASPPLTSREHDVRTPGRAPALHLIRARHVVLAAGTFGSTEILLKSRAEGLRVSDALGTRFSGNGDMISVLYDQPDPVNAAPVETLAYDQRRVGPTITAIAEHDWPRDWRIALEDLAIPAPLRRMFEEIVTTSAVAVRLDALDSSAHAATGRDPAAVDVHAIEHSQVFATMGDDGAAGRLELINGWEGVRSDAVVAVTWEGAGAHELYTRHDATLTQAAKKHGGEYLRSPLWQPFPDGLTRALSGPKPQGKLFSVHPLGGCPMADRVEDGVVDDIGRVFDASDAANHARVHDGLLVLDGSIVPVALGINPLLTITALAERAAAQYARIRGWTLDDAERGPAPLPPLPEVDALTHAARAASAARPTPPITGVRFAEKMIGKLQFDGGGTIASELYVEFGEIRDVPQFLSTGPHAVHVANAALTVGDERVTLSGTVHWMERAKTGVLGRAWRGLSTYLRTRFLPDFVSHSSAISVIDALAFVRLASNVGEIRYLRYEMTLDNALALPGGKNLAAGTRLSGLKTLQYVKGGNPWKQLSQLEVTVTPDGGRGYSAGTLEIDLLHLFERFATQLQIVRQADQPTAIMDQLSIMLFMARIVLKVHFWSFRAADYEPHDAERQNRRVPGPLPGLKMEKHQTSSPIGDSGERLPLVLTRYYRDQPRGTPVLLFHGFGSGGIQFAHPKLKANLAQHLAARGVDVWVAELRTSIGLPSSRNQWTLDEIARDDVPALVDHVLRVAEKPRLDVVAHCIGSAMFCTSVLGGRLGRRGGTSKVRRAVLLQVGPLISLSRGNRFRGHVASAMRRFMAADQVDSSVDANADWQDVLLDRLLNTYPYPDAEQARHELSALHPNTHAANCNRANAVFGRLFQHENVDDATLDCLGELLAHTNLKTFEQTVQYAFLKRLTDYEASNVYVADRNVEDYFNFPVCFVFGLKNDVFDRKTSYRSMRLIKDVFGVQHGITAIPLKNYGHLDPLIGVNAERDVFQKIGDYLLSPVVRSPQAPGGEVVRYVRQPLVGPTLGWTRYDEQGKQWIARVWCRTDDERREADSLIAVVLKDGEAVPDYAFCADVETMAATGNPDVTGVIDVPLPRDGGDYEIAVVALYSVRTAHRDIAADRGGLTRRERPNVIHVDQPPPARRKSAGQRVPVQPLPRVYGDEVARVRQHWESAAPPEEPAPRVCDAGYASAIDSVALPHRLLEKLDPAADALTFAVASCRYPGTLTDRERADATFGRVRDLIRAADADSPSLLLLTGDQIYADAGAGLFDARTHRARFYDNYREAWTAPNARAVMRSIPVYMMLDDHEAGDNWHPLDDGVDEDRRNWGLRSFEQYQYAASPKGHRVRTRAAGDAPRPARDRPRRRIGGYHYAFEAARFPFFMCDTRSTRSEDEIMSRQQLGLLTEWLKRHNDGGPLFVVSPSVLVPFLRSTQGTTPVQAAACAARSDGWDRYPESMKALFAFIAAERIRNVVFLSGDAHYSMVSEISFAGAGCEELRALSIVASPLYAPYPFANLRGSDFVRHGELDLGQGTAMRYSVDAESEWEGDSVTLVGVRAVRGDEADEWVITTRTWAVDGEPAPRSYRLGRGGGMLGEIKVVPHRGTRPVESG
jgi:cholesterol oxidase